MDALARATFQNPYHARAFVGGPDEEQAVIDPLFVEGMKPGQKVVYLVDPAKQSLHEQRPCVYDLRKLRGSMMMELLRSHPLTVINGMIYENPFFTPATELLGELGQHSALS